MDFNQEQLLKQVLEKLDQLDARLGRLETDNTTDLNTGNGEQERTSGRKLSVKEFLIERDPSDDVQKTLAIGYFLETHQGILSFNKKDLEKGFRAAKESLPLNINDKVNMCIRNGHMMDAEEKKDNMKAWVITRAGEQYLMNGFSKTKAKE
jgi:hypothetical protein